MKLNIADQHYSDDDIAELYATKNEFVLKLQNEIGQNKKQTLYFVDGQIAKCIEGRMLLIHFNLEPESQSFQILNFKDYGKDWAIFEIWKKYEARKLWSKKIWEYVTKFGSVLAILLSVIKLLEWFSF